MTVDMNFLTLKCYPIKGLKFFLQQCDKNTQYIKKVVL